jgi:hypothetical protein
MAHVGDEPPQYRGLPGRIGQDERVHEILGEHVRLELQGGVEDPEES